MSEAWNVIFYRCFDKNGIGTISRQDLHAVFENLGEKLIDDEIEGLLDEADTDNEGVISYSEFCAFKNLVWIFNLSFIRKFHLYFKTLQK